MKKQLIAVAAFAIATACGAQSVAYTPSAKEQQQARDNAKRDAKLADAMEKARVKEEAKPVAAYIPKEQPQPVIKEHKPEVFTAKAPGEKKKAAKKKPA
ncbi:MAG TPA: hypothetical protein VMZ74_07010 [Ramlibacter sp.]|nr:hypothetical protein [Ramlibacter sp.]